MFICKRINRDDFSMPKCNICGKVLNNPNSQTHINSKYHQSKLKNAKPINNTKEIHIQNLKSHQKSRNLWESPVYRFRIPKDPEDEPNSDLIEIVINVTKSAPSQNLPSGSLEAVLSQIFKNFKNINYVLDFGAGKLRLAPFILRKDKKLCAVEFEELINNKITKNNIRICKKFGDQFDNLVFPNPFLNDNKKFDLIILINVLPVMPVFAERLFLLSILHKKLKSNGYILWYAMKETKGYKKKRKSNDFVCGDGVWMQEGRKIKTFYKYHKPTELNEMFGTTGFELNKIYPDYIQDIRLYKKNKYNLFSEIISDQIICKEVQFDESIEDPISNKPKIIKRKENPKLIIPNPKSISIENLYINALDQLPSGIEHSSEYHRLTSLIIGRIFHSSLKNMTIQQEENRGRKFIDTVFTNSAKKGFFKDLIDNPNILCQYIIVEAKNYSHDPDNPEFDQLSGRLSKKAGTFGILVCRTIVNQRLALERCQGYLDDDHYVIFLSNNDLIELLNFSYTGLNNEINDFMHDKLRSLVFRTRR